MTDVADVGVLAGVDQRPAAGTGDDGRSGVRGRRGVEAAEQPGGTDPDEHDGDRGGDTGLHLAALAEPRGLIGHRRCARARSILRWRSFVEATCAPSHYVPVMLTGSRS